MKAAGLALILAFAAGGIFGTEAGTWRLQRVVNFVWRNLGVDIRLQRAYQHPFSGYGLYNFSTESWPSIERRPLSSLTSDEFKERYVKGRRPVILTDIKPQLQWTPKNLSLRCGTMPVSFDRRYSAGLRAIPSWMRKLFLDSRTLLTYNHTTEHVLEAMHASTTLEEYVSRLDKDQNSISLAKKVTDGRLYSGNIADYIFPVMLSAQHIERGHCDDLISEGKAVLRRLIEFAAAGRHDPPKFGAMNPVLFVAPGGSRAIPLHQHGPFNDNLLWMLHGSKKIVTVSPSSTEWLYERPEFGGSEYADRVFSADVLEPDAGVQPDVRHVRGMEGIISAGELIYLPVNVPHAIQTQDGTSVMLAWQMPVPGIARLFWMKTCSFLEELSDFPPWAEKCAILKKLMSENQEASD